MSSLNNFNISAVLKLFVILAKKSQIERGGEKGKGQFRLLILSIFDLSKLFSNGKGEKRGRSRGELTRGCTWDYARITLKCVSNFFCVMCRDWDDFLIYHCKYSKGMSERKITLRIV
ncbi:unnamed protein product [Onchocerca flexuosa]|uniref:Uncharacterized protein n=1 Tax=Onchocerca flexuosa TaxID=387005 RepID=A0A183I8J0_9BILA|nr:unnamed protein product [Onchocerca flexuosa]